MRLPLILVLMILLTSPPAARGEGAGGGWGAPVPGAIVGAFVVVADPYAAGQRRGIDLAAARGRSVAAPCSGRVSFTGPVPGGGRGRGVSIRCGRLTATVLGLSRTVSARGVDIVRGQEIGRAAGPIRLGARVTAKRHGYLDPLTLIRGTGRGVPPLVRVPWGHRPAPPTGPAVPRVRGPAGPRPVPRVRLAQPTRSALPRAVPTLAWAGLGLLALGLSADVAASGSRRRRRRERAAVRHVVAR